MEKNTSYPAVDGESQSSDNHSTVTKPHDTCKNISISGWTYKNEHEQMCGPYLENQLQEGRLAGFLPEDLEVYPVVDGNLMNPMPLKYIGHLNGLWSSTFLGFSEKSESQASHVATINSSGEIPMVITLMPL